MSKSAGGEDVEVCYNVICPPEMHIAANIHDIIDILRSNVNVADRKKFSDVIKLVQSISDFEFSDIKRKVKKNFKVFSVAAKKQKLISKQGRGLPSRAELDQTEKQFLKDFTEILRIAQYNHLTQFEWEQALAEEYQFTMPVNVEWEKLDNKLLGEFWKTQDVPEGEIFEQADRVMIYHRGVGLAQNSGLYMNEKIDLLVEYLVSNPMQALSAYFSYYVLRQRSNPKVVKKVKATPSQSADNSMSGAGSGTKATPRAVAGAHADGSTVHSKRRQVERRTLARLLPNTKSVLQKLGSKIHLQEPTFKEVVLLYRKQVKPLNKKQKHKATADQLADLRLEYRNIVIKTFDEVAMADMEMIFPFKKVQLKAVFKIQVFVTIVTALVGFIVSLFSSAITTSMVMSGLSVVGGRLAQVYSQAQAQRAQMMQDMSLQLFDKSNDSQEGVVVHLLDEMSDQFMKEVILAYFLLYQSKKALTVQELDEMVEEFLFQNFHLHLDFSTTTTLTKMMAYQLIHKTEDDTYQAASLDSAYTALEAKWSTAFRSVGEETGSVFSGSAALGVSLSNPIGGAVGAVGAVGSGLVSGVSAVGKGVMDVNKSGLRLLGLRSRHSSQAK